tara:strand:+ start:384 stop:1355 length:972 start_codon:yes stop_codon:yes gene_type:complete
MKNLSIALLLSYSLSAFAGTSFIERDDVKAFIKSVEKQYHLPKKELVNTLSQVKLKKKVLHSIKNPKEANAWTNYRGIFITKSRINAGLTFQKKNQALLVKAEKKYGVPQEIILAILGVETNFGSKQGSYRVLDSLSTLAFDFERRSQFFKKELANFLVLCHEQKFKPTSVYGSYAGAIGQPQFMPSSYRAYAVDFSGDGKKDLRNNTADAIGSIANYLSVHGWKHNQGITEQASIIGNNYKRMITKARYAQHRISRLNRNGIKTQHAKQATKGSLLAFKSPKDTEYWLAYPNFFVITKYNTSKQYALAVHLLAEEFKTKKTA